MNDLTSYVQTIEKELNQFSLPEKPTRLYEPIQYFLSIGGKRIRPVLTILGEELYNPGESKSLPQAISIELFHNFTLIHDDIMDNAPLRRGFKTVHEKWDDNIAILSGDALLIKAYQKLAECSPDKLPDLLSVFNRTAIDVCEGQQLDMDFESRLDVTINEYIEMIRLKTSALLGCALELGAIVAGADEDECKMISSFGENIGVAFQIKDDILDLYADPDKFGKQVGGDVIANKKTILFLSALAEAGSSQRAILRQLQSEKDLELKLARTKELYDHLNVSELCRDLMDEHYNRALIALEQIKVPEENKKSLRGLAQYLIERDL